MSQKHRTVTWQPCGEVQGEQIEDLVQVRNFETWISGKVEGEKRMGGRDVEKVDSQDTSHL